MDINLVNDIARRLGYGKTDLIEKDILLQLLLHDLSSDRQFSRDFLFKGGTCLIKAYAGYFRFSEDLDFTYRNQEEFSGMSGSKIRSYLSAKISDMAKMLEGIASGRGMDFRADQEHMERGGSNKSVTFKIFYDSVVLRRRAFIKIQVSFVERICLKPKRKRLDPLAAGADDRELRRLYPDYAEYVKPVYFMAYDEREIAAEKVRAILTRMGTKGRDFFDLYMLYQRFGITPRSVERYSIVKTRFALQTYEKYRRQFRERAESGVRFPDLAGEQDMLIVRPDAKRFLTFSRGLEAYMVELVARLRQED
ncbi:MAG: nucleotidyl transferase AbiEii/AbiGii toxin family protein [Candidatus Micrarchaeota archaeon]|nr:nucleotidyl transferase AbiEii/AbiGii toxin family protein [Candidatus Micrarchaeota archaeon]